jgi:hypothetical protein
MKMNCDEKLEWSETVKCPWCGVEYDIKIYILQNTEHRCQLCAKKFILMHKVTHKTRKI